MESLAGVSFRLRLRACVRVSGRRVSPTLRARVRVQRSCVRVLFECAAPVYVCLSSPVRLIHTHTGRGLMQPHV